MIILLAFFVVVLCCAPSLADTVTAPAPTTKPLISLASDNVRLGPIRYIDPSPFQLQRVNATPGCVDMFSKGDFLLSGALSWNNRWACKPGRFFVDGEFLQFSIDAAYGITDWLMLRLQIPFGWRGGGVMDGFIMGFHDTFGFGQVGRDLFPRDKFSLVLWREDGSLYRLTEKDAGAGMEDLVLTAKFRITDGTRWIPLVYLSLNLTLPTGNEDELWGIGNVSGGPTLSLAKRIWRLYFYLDLQYTAYASGELVGIAMEQNQFSILTAIEWSIVERWSLILQYQWHSGATKNFYEFAKPTNQVGLGFKAVVARETVVSFGILENFVFFDNSPDLALAFNVAHKF